MKPPGKVDGREWFERATRDRAIADVAFVVYVEAPCPPRYRKAVADYIRSRVGNL